MAIVSELMHISSLMHDDVVDISNMRRGKNSVNRICGDKNVRISNLNSIYYLCEFISVIF